ncbi:hypothetical protein ACQP1W_18110 [Spirillospora sp. CA-255316]
MAVVGATSLGTAVAAEATDKPRPRSSLPVECRLALRSGDWHTLRRCKEAWQAMYEARHRARLERQLRERYNNRTEKQPQRVQTSSPAKSRDEPSSPPVTPPPVRTPSPPTPLPTATQELARDTSEAASLQPLLLLGLLLPAAAAVGYPMRRRIYAMAGASFVTPLPPPAEQKAGFTYRPAIDPFAVPVLGLTGAGASAAARVFTLSALEEFGNTALVVIPRPDATALFGLAEDDLLDESGADLFIPGNLDAALAYMETELAIRRNTGVAGAPRLLLVADCDKETERIAELRSRHPEEFAAVLLGDWPGESASVDEDGLVQAAPALAAALPERLPAMSRTEARDRLNAAVQRHPPTPRRSRRR